jgi:hypothetical protein
LNPTIKDVYFRTRWGEEEYKKGMKALEEVVSSLSPIRISNSFLTIFSSTSTMLPVRQKAKSKVLPQHPRLFNVATFNPTLSSGMEALS